VLDISVLAAHTIFPKIIVIFYFCLKVPASGEQMGKPLDCWKRIYSWASLI